MSAEIVEQSSRDEIRARAMAVAEANVYSLENQYLSKDQKVDVEAIYQLPLHAFDYVLLAQIAFAGASFGRAYISAAAVSVVVTIVLWNVMNTTIAKFGFFFAGFFYGLVMFAFLVYLVYLGKWSGVAFAAVGLLGLSSAIAPPMFLFTILARRMHPKYVIAKKLFGITFPFESASR